MSFSRDDIGMSSDEQFLSRLGHPDRLIFFSKTQKEASDFFAHSIFFGISKFSML